MRHVRCVIASRFFSAALVIAVAVGIGVLNAEQGGALFTASPFADAADVGVAKAQVRARAVGIDFGRLPASVSEERPVRVVLNAFADVQLVAAIDRIESNGLGSATYIGHVEGLANHVEGLDDNSVVLVVSDGVMIGTINTPDTAYQIRFNGTTHVIREVDVSQFPDESDPTPTADLPLTRDAGAPDGASSDDGSRVDVMVLYTDDARLAAGGTTAIQNLITLGVTETNQMYTNSGIGTRMRLVHMREVAYAETNNAQLDRDRLFDSSDGILDAAHTWRNTYGADMVQMIVSDAGCGIAYLNGPAASMAGQSAYAWAVTDDGCVSPNYTFAHEFGHIQGSNHAPEDPTGTGAYSYSFGFKRCATTPYFRSVMAYQCASGATGTIRSKYFSNPAVDFSAAPTGTATQNNALTLHNTRSIIANWRQQVPLIDVVSLWPPADAADRRVGQTTRLWAYVRNNGPYTLSANQHVWFYTDGPGTSTGEGWVGSDDLAGLAPGAAAWYGFDWTIPLTADPGAWSYWARVWDAVAVEYLSDWQGPQAFTILSLSASITATYPVPDSQAGQADANLWAYVNNTGTGTFPANTYVYYWVEGPGLSGYIGSTSVAGLAPGGAAWYKYTWDVPINRTAGAHTYWAIIWTYSASGGGWRSLSNWSPSQTWNISAAPAYYGNVTQTWTVYRSGTSNPPQSGFPARLWALGYNSGTATHDANVHLWYYVSGPGTPGWVGSVATTGQTSGSSVWRYFDWNVPAVGTYTYYGVFWRYNGVSWTQVGPWSAGRDFGVASDQSADQPLGDPVPLPANIPAPTRPPSGQ